MVHSDFHVKPSRFGSQFIVVIKQTLFNEKTHLTLVNLSWEPQFNTHVRKKKIQNNITQQQLADVTLILLICVSTCICIYYILMLNRVKNIIY